DRAVRQEELEPVCGSQVVVGLAVVEPGANEAVPGQRPGDRAGAVGEVGRLSEVAERLEIRVTKAPELGAARLEIELRGGGSEIHRQRMERVRDAAVAPVEEDVPPTGEENLPIVEVVVLDRLGDPVAGELPAERLELGERRERALLLGRRQ